MTKRYLTTEQLAAKLLRDAETSTEEEKAAARKELDKAFGNKPADDQPVTLHEGVNIFVRDLSKLSSRTRMWLRFWKERN